MQRATSGESKTSCFSCLHTRNHWCHGPGPFWSGKVGPFTFALVPQMDKNLRDCKRRRASTVLSPWHPLHSCPHITIQCEAPTGREDRQAEQKLNTERPAEHLRAPILQEEEQEASPRLGCPTPHLSKQSTHTSPKGAVTFTPSRPSAESSGVQSSAVPRLPRQQA